MTKQGRFSRDESSSIDSCRGKIPERFVDKFSKRKKGYHPMKNKTGRKSKY